MKKQKGSMSPECGIILLARIMAYSKARHAQKSASRLVKNLDLLGSFPRAISLRLCEKPIF